MKMLFLAPESVRQPPIAGWRCAGCDRRIAGTVGRLPTFCVFCEAWAHWRHEGDELWARALHHWEDDGGRSAGQDRAGGADR
jgi:hypothetical protein